LPASPCRFFQGVSQVQTPGYDFIPLVVSNSAHFNSSQGIAGAPLNHSFFSSSKERRNSNSISWTGINQQHVGGAIPKATP